ncbi:pentapeptide repeat-containing protein, partial [Methyloterricola oryzae]|uniref:pentapeptide repeat-containing protein n=1 Tax=Methyloterricola oryzae TaxID=1495050 RepID=UPI00138DF163
MLTSIDASAYQCIHAATPPAPPPNGVVLGIPGGIALVLTLPTDSVHPVSLTGDCVGPELAPHSISVAPGVALAFFGTDSGTQTKDALVLPWGAVNAQNSNGIPLLNLYNGRVGTMGRYQFWGGLTSIRLMDTSNMLQQYFSCRSCVFPPNSSFILSGVPPQVIDYLGDLTNAKMPKAKVVNLPDVGFKFDGADLSGATLLGRFNNSSFSNVTVDGTTFGADLIGATFSEILYKTTPPTFGGNLGGTGDQCTQFKNSNLIGASFDTLMWQPALPCSEPWFPGSQLDLKAVGQLLIASKPQAPNGGPINWTGAQVIATAADRKALAGIDLSGAIIEGLKIQGEAADLTGIHLDGATLSGVDLSLATLTNASLTNVNAARAIFQYADLSGANFSGQQTKLQTADFVNAILSGAKFANADLSGAAFNGALGRDVDFSGATAIDAVFRGAHLYGNGQAFNNATDLSNIDFSNAVLASDPTQSGGFDFTGATL